MFVKRVDFKLLKEQLLYILPLGFASLIFQFNNQISNVIMSANLGAAALAIYAVGNQNIPIISIVRQSVSNVIFPEMALKSDKNPMEALHLWNKSNVLYLFLVSTCFHGIFLLC